MYVFYKHALLHGLNISLVFAPALNFSSSVVFRLYPPPPNPRPTFFPSKALTPPTPPQLPLPFAPSYWLLLNASCVARLFLPRLRVCFFTPASQLRARVFPSDACEERPCSATADAAHAEGGPAVADSSALRQKDSCWHSLLCAGTSRARR